MYTASPRAQHRMGHIDADIMPEVKSSRRRREIFNKLRHEIRPELFQAVVVFDGQKNIFSQRRLPIDGNAGMYEVNMSSNTQPTQGSKGVYQVVINAAEAMVIDIDEVLRVVNGSAQTLTSTTAMQVLNILVQQAAVSAYPNASTGRNTIYIDQDKDCIDLDAGIEIWKGYFQSVRLASGSLIVNVDVATGVMYLRGELVNVASQISGLRNDRLLASLKARSPELQRLKLLLQGLKVKQSRGQMRARIHCIHTIVCNAGGYEFTLNNGERTTVAEHFLITYGKQLRHPEFPGIKTKSGAVIPFEECEVVPGQLFKKPLTPEMSQAVLRSSTIRPEKRFDSIQYGIENLGYNSMYLDHLGINVHMTPLEICGRTITPPVITYNKGLTVLPRDGSWNLVGKQFVEPGRVRAWAVVSFAPPKEITREDVQKFLMILMNCMGNLGIQVDMTTPPILAGNPQSDNIKDQLLNAGKAAIAESKGSAKRPDILILIIPPNSATLRKQIKQCGDILNDFATQCVRSDNMPTAANNRANQYCNNLLTKINAKLGGVCSRLASGLEWMRDTPTMIVGADVTHPGPGILRPSVAGVVASVDQFASRYISTCSVQEPRLENIAGLKNMMKQLFIEYHIYWSIKNRDVWPQQILFYRDGVSEGELMQVLEQELPQIKDAALELHQEGKWMAPAPKITFVVVGKRHHIRFAPRNPQEGDRSGNCHAGFVADHTITNPKGEGFYKDFYLQSHGGLLGTSRPSHYILLHDENGFDMNGLQSLTYALCHTYARSTRSVSIPAPVYYADIVCARSDFHYDPNLANEEDTASDSSGKVFDLKQWVAGFRNAGPSQRRNMYFM